MRNEDYFDAIERGDVKRLEELVATEPELLRATKQLNCTGLHSAIYAKQPGVARSLVDAGIDIEAVTKEGRSALHDSIEFGNPEVTELLLQRGAHLDICSAAILGRLERLRELLDRDKKLANNRSTGLSPLGWASYGNQVETARELIRCGARMDDGELLCAASVGHVEVGRLLIDHGADPKAIFEGNGCNALHTAAAMRYTSDSRRFIEMLLQAGAEIDARTTGGKTAFEIAEEAAESREPGSGDKRYREVAALLRGASTQ